jgi:hypothetical protein
MGNKQEGARAAVEFLSAFRKTKDDDAPAVDPENPTADALAVVAEAVANSRPDYGALQDAIASINLQTETVDLAPLIEAVAGLSERVAFDAGPLVAAIEAIDTTVDLSEVERHLNEIRQTLQSGNAIMMQLVRAAKAEKVVTYDAEGRVSSISVKEPE